MDNYIFNTFKHLTNNHTMKKLLPLLLFIPFISFGQTVNGLAVEDIPARYVKIVSVGKVFKIFEVNVYVDYGQINSMKDMKKGHILSSEGKQYGWNGPMGVLNFFERKGFKFITQYAISGQGGDAYHTLLENTNYKKQREE